MRLIFILLVACTFMTACSEKTNESVESTSDDIKNSLQSAADDIADSAESAADDIKKHVFDSQQKALEKAKNLQKELDAAAEEQRKKIEEAMQ